MKRSFFCLFLLVALYGTTAAAAQTRSGGVKIVSLPGHVMQGSLEHLNAVVPRPTTCSLTVRYGHSKQALGQKTARINRVAWTWRVPLRAPVGKATAHVSCRNLAAKSGTFTVVRHLVPASVAVVKTGLTQVPDTFDSGTEISYGIELVNRSPDQDARNVEVDVNLLDAAGNAIASDSHFVAGIPAGATYYFGYLTSTNSPTEVPRITAVAKVGYSARKSLLPPAVSNVRLSADSLDGSVVVDGDVTNEATKNLSSLAEITAVFFNNAGDIVGGGEDFPSFGLPPGAQTAFEIDTAPGGPQASNVAQVKVSVDPDYGTS